MATISEFMDGLPNMVNNVLKNQLLNKLDPELKQRMYDAGGDISIDFDGRSFSVIAGSDELEKAIIADLKSKR